MGYLYQMDVEGVPVESWEIPGRPFVVGRGESADAKIFDQSLSRSHFMIIREAGHDFVVDLESQNGTAINGERVTGRRLEPGAVIHAGNSVFYFSRHRLPIGARPLSAATVYPHRVTTAQAQPVA